MKIYLRSIMFLVLLQSNFIFCQTDIIGKSFTALISTSCEEFINGGCTIQNYCTLKFNKKTVDITYFNETYCTPKSFEKLNDENAKQNKEALLWSKQNSKIFIEGLNDFGNLYLANENMIFGTKESYGELKELRFINMEK